MSADVFDSLIEEYELQEAENGEYFGEINDHPTVLKILSIDPVGVMFKVRVNSEDEHEIEFSEKMLELIRAKKINVSVENGYGWLTLYDLSGFEAEEVSDLLEELTDAIEENGLSLSDNCSVCKSSESVTIYYSESRINRLCSNCLEDKERQQSERNKKLLEVKPSSVFLCVLGITGFAVVWAAMWFLYDYMFVIFGTDEIEVSDYAIAIGALAAIVLLSVTIGLPLRRFGIQNATFLSVIACICVVAAFVLGEVLLAMIWAIQSTEKFTIVTSIQYYIWSWQNQTPMFKVVKTGLVICSIVGVHIIGRKKRAALEI